LKIKKKVIYMIKFISLVLNIIMGSMVVVLVSILLIKLYFSFMSFICFNFGHKWKHVQEYKGLFVYCSRCGEEGLDLGETK